MKEMTIGELTETLESVREAVDASGFGPVYQVEDRNGVITKVVSPLGFQVYQSTLERILANPDKIKILPVEKTSNFSNT